MKPLPPLTQEEQDEIEAEYMGMALLMPEELFRAKVGELKAEGVVFSLDKIDGFLKLAQYFKCSIPRVLVRALQIMPELRRKLSID